MSFHFSPNHPLELSFNNTLWDTGHKYKTRPEYNMQHDLLSLFQTYDGCCCRQADARRQFYSTFCGRSVKLELLKTMVLATQSHCMDVRHGLWELQIQTDWRHLRQTATEHPADWSVLEELGMERQFLSTVKRLKLQCLSHVTRAHHISTDIGFVEGSINGKRSWGRIDDIRDWIRKPLPECTTVARERKPWRELVHTASSVLMTGTDKTF